MWRGRKTKFLTAGHTTAVATTVAAAAAAAAAASWFQL